MLEGLTKNLGNIIAGLRGRKITEGNIADTVRDIQRALLEADVALPVVRDFVKTVREKALGAEVVKGVDSGQQFVKIVYDELTALMGPAAPEWEWSKNRPTVILMAGLQGSGKTTTSAKLARFLSERKKRKPMLVAADLQRPAAIEQLKVLGKQLDLPVFHEPGLTPPEVCARAVELAAGTGCDTVILDTAGRLHIDEELMAELKDVADRTKPDEVFLVCDAMTGQDAVNSAREFNQSLELTGVILTKLDGDARGGAALSVKAITGKPIRFVGVGEKLDRLEEFHPERMASRMLGMGDIVSFVEDAQLKLDQKEQLEMQEKLLQAQFDLNDFLKQLQNIKKLGSFKELLGRLPGFGAQMENLELEGNELVPIEAMIQSMTLEERRRPEILNTGRRTRIARGSGREIGEVNDLLKQFKQMREFMQAMKGGGGLFGRMKAMRGLKEQAKQLAAAGRPGSPGGSGGNGGAGGGAARPAPMAMPQFLPTPAGGAAEGGERKRQNKMNAKDLRKKRKDERQRRRKGRKR